MMLKLKETKLLDTIISLAIIFLSLLSLTPSTTFAWLNDVYDSSITKGIGNFDYSFKVYFKYNNEEIDVTNNNDYKTDSKYYIVNVMDENAINYIKNLYIEINIQAFVSSYVRVRIFDQLVKYKIIYDGNQEVGRNGSILRDELQPYVFSENWIDYRHKDNYIYYPELIDVRNKNENEEYYSLTIPLIDYVDITTTNSNGVLRYPKVTTGTVIYELYFTLEVQAVQYNRYKEIWKIDEIPQL